jgi:hypothetical protein
MPNTDFIPDPNLQQFAIHNAESCVRFFGQGFGRIGDYTDASVAMVEEVLDLLWKNIPTARPTQKQVEEHATRIGCYLGETYRRNHGGEWGATQNGENVAMRTLSGIIFYPWNRVMKRLTNGDEDEVLAWYHYLIRYEEEEKGRQKVTPPPLPPTGSGPTPLPK